MKPTPQLCMLYPTNIFTFSPSSTPCDRRQRSKILFRNYFNLTSTKKAQLRKYIQILADPISVSSKPFIWVGLFFENYLILLKAPPPSTTSLEESSVKSVFETHSHNTLQNYVRERVSMGHLQRGKIPDLSQADTSYYQIHKIQPITKHHILLLGFAIITQKPIEICQVLCKNQSHINTCKR